MVIKALKKGEIPIESDMEHFSEQFNGKFFKWISKFLDAIFLGSE